MLGELKIPVRGRFYFTVFGGPFRQKPKNMKGVKMAVEIDAPCDVSIPTHDYQVPERKALNRGLLQTVQLLIKGEPVYVGCMGGQGRTGLFLAVLAKSLGVRQAVKYVRANYYPHAVETPEQAKFVKSFTAAPQVNIALKALRKKLFWAQLNPFKPSELTVRPREPKTCRFGHTQRVKQCASCGWGDGPEPTSLEIA